MPGPDRWPVKPVGSTPRCYDWDCCFFVLAQQRHRMGLQKTPTAPPIWPNPSPMPRIRGTRRVLPPMTPTTFYITPAGNTVSDPDHGVARTARPARQPDPITFPPSRCRSCCRPTRFAATPHQRAARSRPRAEQPQRAAGLSAALLTTTAPFTLAGRDNPPPPAASPSTNSRGASMTNGVARLLQVQPSRRHGVHHRHGSVTRGQ